MYWCLVYEPVCWNPMLLCKSLKYKLILKKLLYTIDCIVHLAEKL